MNILDTRTTKKFKYQTAFVIFAILFLLLCNPLNAKCILPVADGTDEVVTDRNIAGYLVSMKSGAIYLREYKTSKIVKINLAGLRVAYSAYGGDFSIGELKAGIPMRIWYKDCKKQRDGRSVAAYVEFFSNDLDDRPPDDYFSARGQ